jgi:hypothetical protein
MSYSLVVTQNKKQKHKLQLNLLGIGF